MARLPQKKSIRPAKKTAPKKVVKKAVKVTKKVAVKNNREEGFIYFFDRIDNQTKVKSLAYAFVKKQKDNKLMSINDILDGLIENDLKISDLLKTLQ